MLTATLDADGAQTSVFIVPTGKTLIWSIDETDLADGEVILFVSRDGRGTWQPVVRASADSDGRIPNTQASDIFAYFELRETGETLAGEAAVSLSLQPMATVTVRDTETGEPIVAYGATITPYVPLDFSSVPIYADNAAALADGAALGTVYATAVGALAIVVAGE